MPRPQRGDRRQRGEGPSALKLADEDQGTIDKLKGEVEKAWKMVDASRRRRRAKEECPGAEEGGCPISPKPPRRSGSGGAKQQEQLKDMMRQREVNSQRERDER